FPLRQNGQFPALRSSCRTQERSHFRFRSPGPGSRRSIRRALESDAPGCPATLETGRPLRQVGQMLEFGEKVGVIQKVVFDSTFEDHDLHMLVNFELRHDLLELHDELRPHQIQWRVVEYDAAIGWQLPGQPYLR